MGLVHRVLFDWHYSGDGVLLGMQKNKVEVQKLVLDTAVRTTELRKQENDEYAQIIDLTRRYVDARDQYDKSPSPQLNNEIVEMKRQLDLTKEDFTVLEINSLFWRIESQGVSR
jgi:hypothetical protein